jgi:membrane protease YdiL (CAAX protease family)
MKNGEASGIQIAFLIFAGLLLVVPIATFLVDLFPGSREERALLERSSPFILGVLVLTTVPPLRRRCVELLSTPIPQSKRSEVTIFALAHLCIPFAAIAAILLTQWALMGKIDLESKAIGHGSAGRSWATSLTAVDIARNFVMAGMLAPLTEELVFRDFLYRAWERQCGWIVSMILTSIAFALYHPVFLSAFLGSVTYVCVIRRTGSIWSAIIPHSFGNVMLWYPFMGQFAFPVSQPGVRDPVFWWPHFASLAFVVVALPIYIWMSRRPFEPQAAAP